jgi:hypothetical protein
MLLTAEEAALVLDGYIADPTYRPMLVSVYQSSVDLYKQSDIGDDVDPLSRYESGPTAPPARPRQAEQVREDDTPVTFPRMVPARYWAGHAGAVVVLLVGSADGVKVVGLATVSGGTRNRKSHGIRDVQVGPWRVVHPFPLSDLMEGLDSAQRTRLERMLYEPIRDLPQAMDEIVRRNLRRLYPDYDATVRELQPTMSSAIDRSPAGIHRRDRVATALRMFGYKYWKDVVPEPSDEAEELRSEYADALVHSVVAHEDDYITDDAAVFPSWQRSDRPNRGWWVFRSRSRRLLVKNINVSTAEGRTGADLVYVRRNPDAVVLVQYKLLEKSKKPARLLYRPNDGRLNSQMIRLLDLEKPPEGAAEWSVDEYRIGPGFTFVKFVAPYPPNRTQNDGLSDGFYFPTAVLQKMLEKPDTGPSGGTVFYPDARRYIDPSTFVKLVQDNWIGTTARATDVVFEALGLRRPEERTPFTIAVDELSDLW